MKYDQQQREIRKEFVQLLPELLSFALCVFLVIFVRAVSPSDDSAANRLPVPCAYSSSSSSARTVAMTDGSGIDDSPSATQPASGPVCSSIAYSINPE